MRQLGIEELEILGDARLAFWGDPLPLPLQKFRKKNYTDEADNSILYLISAVTSLKRVTVSHAPYLRGKIPTLLGNLSNLEKLNLFENSLTGSIPSELGSLTKLKWLDLSSNRLTGVIPTELLGLTSLTKLLLSANHLNELKGEIPSELRRFYKDANHFNKFQYSK